MTDAPWGTLVDLDPADVALDSAGMWAKYWSRGYTVGRPLGVPTSERGCGLLVEFYSTLSVGERLRGQLPLLPVGFGDIPIEDFDSEGEYEDPATRFFSRFMKQFGLGVAFFKGSVAAFLVPEVEYLPGEVMSVQPAIGFITGQRYADADGDFPSDDFWDQIVASLPDPLTAKPIKGKEEEEAGPPDDEAVPGYRAGEALSDGEAREEADEELVEAALTAPREFFNFLSRAATDGGLTIVDEDKVAKWQAADGKSALRSFVGTMGYSTSDEVAVLLALESLFPRKPLIFNSSDITEQLQGDVVIYHNQIPPEYNFPDSERDAGLLVITSSFVSGEVALLAAAGFVHSRLANLTITQYGAGTSSSSDAFGDYLARVSSATSGARSCLLAVLSSEHPAWFTFEGEGGDARVVSVSIGAASGVGRLALTVDDSTTVYAKLKPFLDMLEGDCSLLL